jgi:hypothetical protein
MFKHTTMTSLHLAGALALTFAGAGCLSAPEDQTGAELEGIGQSLELVHTIDEGNGHTLEFYDAGDGAVAVKEEFFASDSARLDRVPDGNYSLAELYRRVRPSGEIPQGILSADVHAKSVLARLEKLHAERPEFQMPTQSQVGERLRAPAGAGDVEVRNDAVVSCSADLFGDQWGKQWWIANFCQWWDGFGSCSSGFTTVSHVENVGTISASWGGGKFWQYKQFEGDFNVAGKFKIYRTGFPYPTAQVFGEGPVNPRKVVIWNISGGSSWQTNHASGSSPCGHAMDAVVWCS